MNTELKIILAKAIQQCVESAGEAESIKHADNPKWMEVVDILDECTDDLRAMEKTL